MANYSTVVKLAETTDGDCLYMAYHPELPDVVSQGETPEEAEANLANVRQMVVEHLQLHGLPVPEPRPFPGVFGETVSVDQGVPEEERLVAPVFAPLTVS